MKRIESITQLGIILIIVQTILGFIVLFYGVMYREIDTKNAASMLEFIRTNNPSYYEKLTGEENTTYQKEFYKHYTIKGKPKIILCGLFFLAVAVNIAIPLLYKVFMETKKMILEKSEMPEENQPLPVEEGKK